MKDNKNDTITIRTTTELKESLQKMANAENRTLSNMVEVILEAAVKSQKKK